jgi:hypothetical protein
MERTLGHLAWLDELREGHFPSASVPNLNSDGSEAGMSKITKAAYSRRNQLSYQEFADGPTGDPSLD